MKLELMDVEEFIKTNKLGQVKTIKLYEKPGQTDPSGLFSELLFGRFGSFERRKKFAYIDLRAKIIHPEAYQILTGLGPTVSKLISGKAKYILKDGLLVEDPDNGKSGIDFLVSIFSKLKLETFQKDRPKNVQFIKTNINKIFISKYLVLPAGIRDLSISKTSTKTMVNFSDLSEMYATLVRQTNALGDSAENLPEEIKVPLVEQVQHTVLSINDWIKNRLKGRSGLIRGGLLRKVTDYSGRLVITTDHTLELGTVGLPWQVVLKLYEPFAINFILKKDSSAIGMIQQFLKSETPPDVGDLKRLFAKLISTPEIIPDELKEYFIHVAEEIIRDKVVIYKRDPVEDRDSWIAANVRVDRDGMCMQLNPLDLPRIGGDHDGDAIAVLSLFTKEAQQEAKEKMHPKYAKTIWTKILSANKCPYTITLDAATAIYAATKQ